MKKEPTTEEKLENAIKHQPDRYIVIRNKEGRLIKVQDADTDGLWIKTVNGDWMCIQ